MSSSSLKRLLKLIATGLIAHKNLPEMYQKKDKVFRKMCLVSPHLA